MHYAIGHAEVAFENFISEGSFKGHVLIFCEFGIDSICALRILVNIFLKYNIRYQIVPVTNNEQLETKINNSKPKDSDKSNIDRVVFINCGGNLDLNKFWFLSHKIPILLQDIKRPVNHTNVNEELILILDDDFYNFEACPSNEEVLAAKTNKNEDFDAIDFYNQIHNENDNEEDDAVEDHLLDLSSEEMLYDDNDDEDNKKEDNGIENGKSGKKASKKESKVDSDVDDLFEEYEEEDNTGEGKLMSSKVLSSKKKLKRKILNEKKLNKLNTKKDKIADNNIGKLKKQKIKNYYAGCYNGMPSAWILYQFATCGKIQNSENLWLAIVGSMDQYLNERINQEQYEIFFQGAERFAKLLNFKHGYNVKPRATTIRYGEENGGKEEEIQPETENKLPLCIFTEADCKLFLYKYWNLYDSFLNSDFTVSNLYTWREQGKDEVNKILALMGIPTYEAKQKYIYMKTDSKLLFKKKLPEITNKFLKGFMYNSFNYQFDETVQMSAGDFYACLTALLNRPSILKYEDIGLDNHNEEDKENGQKDFDIINDKRNKKNDINLLTDINKNMDTHDFLNNTNHNSNKNDNKNITTDPVKNEETLEERLDNYNENFWIVYNILSLKDTKKIIKSIDLAISYQKALISLSTNIINRNYIYTSKDFRYTVIGDMSEEVKYIQNPLSLERFGILTMNIYEKFRTHNKPDLYAPKPFILGILNGKFYYVAGLTLKSKDSENNKNIFPFKFKFSAHKINATLLLSSFNDAIVEISKDELLSFIDIMIGEE